MSTNRLPSYGGMSSIAQKYGRWALGMGSPGEQILATTIVGVVVLVSSTVSLGATLVLLPVVAFWWLIGWFRLIPGVNGYWPL